MAILLPYQDITPEQRGSIRELLQQFKGEISQCSLHPDAVQVALNDNEISQQRGQAFLDGLIEILKPGRWGTDLPIGLPKRNHPPECYTSRYKFNIPYDPSLD